MDAETVDEPDGADAEDAAAERRSKTTDHALAERDQFKDIALRLQADFDNYRKRVAQGPSDEVDRATGRLVEALLPVLDACEAGVHPRRRSGRADLVGAHRRLAEAEGLEALDLQGKPFDPSVADAVVHEPGADDEVDQPIVSETMRTGYTWKGKVLRPAMVKGEGLIATNTRR